MTIGAYAPAEDQTASAGGYEALRTHPFLPPDFDEEVFASLWTVWPEPERSAAEKADNATRRQLTFSYYGLIPDTAAVGSNTLGLNAEALKPSPLGYVVDARGQWTMNCLACHGGKVAGQVIPGLPNSHIALQTLTEDVRTVKLQQGKMLSHLDLGSLKVPLGSSNGTTNAVIFGVALGSLRNPDMSLNLTRGLPPLLHHDVDAPPFWNVRKKKSLYADGHSPKTPRPLMQFILLPQVNLAKLTEWEPQFADILAWIESLEPPKYPFEIDLTLAARGERVFIDNCARCHGTYGADGEYEQKTIELDEVGTDPLRFRSLTREQRQGVKDSWLSRFGVDLVEVDPIGYVAPPLDGIWASAPYFHNGSVPTLWHVLHPETRPIVWKRTEDGYDREQVGLEIETFDEVPSGVKTAVHRRRYFNTQLPGKSAAGHTFPSVLNEDEKSELLQYLKTL
ncbi:MAG: cytochrome c [Planctomycetaceae bacterium]|nr:cytochrome c [Planctomycetaceae bacterium]